MKFLSNLRIQAFLFTLFNNYLTSLYLVIWVIQCMRYIFSVEYIASFDRFLVFTALSFILMATIASVELFYFTFKKWVAPALGLIPLLSGALFLAAFGLINGISNGYGRFPSSMYATIFFSLIVWILNFHLHSKHRGANKTLCS